MTQEFSQQLSEKLNQKFSNKKVCILGAGREGLATVEFLQKFTSATITLAEQKEIEQTDSTTTHACGKNYPTSLAEFDIIIISPGIPPHIPLLHTAKPDSITTATNIFFENCPCKIIAVTGSKGKSTTSSLIHKILEKQNSYLVGNIGNPALKTLPNLKETDTVVFELSSYQAKRLTKGPDIAIITNLFPEHIDYHGSIEQYYEDKLNVVKQQTNGQLTIYFGENAELKTRIEKIQQNSSRPQQDFISFPNEKFAHVVGDELYFDQTPLIKISDIKLQGAHNTNNILGAITVTLQQLLPLNVSPQTTASAIQNFQPLPHRLQNIGTYHHITFYNDSISTTPDSAIAALEALPNVGSLFIGGQDRRGASGEHYDFSQLAATIKAKNIQTIIYFKETGEALKQEFKKINYQPQHTYDFPLQEKTTKAAREHAMNEAIRFAYDHTPKNTICLLSCASPSYNLFENFEERGDIFEASVKKFAK